MMEKEAEKILMDAFKLFDEHLKNNIDMAEAETQLASHVANQYKAFLKVGFTEAQSFELVKEVVKVFV